MKYRYFKFIYYYPNKKFWRWYRIKPNGDVESKDKDKRWLKVATDDLVKLHEESVKEFSEEEYFLSML